MTIGEKLTLTVGIVESLVEMAVPVRKEDTDIIEHIKFRIACAKTKRNDKGCLDYEKRRREKRKAK